MTGEKGVNKETADRDTTYVQHCSSAGKDVRENQVGGMTWEKGLCCDSCTD